MKFVVIDLTDKKKNYVLREKFMERFKGEITYAVLFAVRGFGGIFRGGGRGGTTQNCRTVFENSVSRPVFHR